MMMEVIPHTVSVDSPIHYIYIYIYIYIYANVSGHEV
jgi:hypothetical protein